MFRYTVRLHVSGAPLTPAGPPHSAGGAGRAAGGLWCHDVTLSAGQGNLGRHCSLEALFREGRKTGSELTVRSGMSPIGASNPHTGPGLLDRAGGGRGQKIASSARHAVRSEQRLDDSISQHLGDA